MASRQSAFRGLRHWLRHSFTASEPSTNSIPKFAFTSNGTAGADAGVHWRRHRLGVHACGIATAHASGPQRAASRPTHADRGVGVANGRRARGQLPSGEPRHAH